MPIASLFEPYKLLAGYTQHLTNCQRVRILDFVVGGKFLPRNAVLEGNTIQRFAGGDCMRLLARGVPTGIRLILTTATGDVQDGINSQCIRVSDAVCRSKVLIVKVVL